MPLLVLGGHRAARLAGRRGGRRQVAEEAVHMLDGRGLWPPLCAHVQPLPPPAAHARGAAACARAHVHLPGVGEPRREERA